MSLTVIDLARIVAQLRTRGEPAPNPIRLTGDQLEQIKASSVVAGRACDMLDGPIKILGTPIEMVAGVEDSTPWLQEWL